MRRLPGRLSVEVIFSMADPKPRLRAPKGKMVTARIEFTEGAAGQFCEGPTQTVVEMKYESTEALISDLRELEPWIKNVTASLNGKILDLRNISGV